MTASTEASRAPLSPADVIQLLRDGNDRFRAGERTERDVRADVAATSGGQWPLAAVLGCIDSRAPAELLFDRGIGDLFNVRIAGNFANDDILGSLEFACKIAGAKAIVVLGHTACGAVKGACDGVELGHLTGLLGCLKPAVDAVAEPSDAAERTSANGAFVDSVARRNVERTVDALAARSPELRALAESGDIAIVGAMYDVATGAVEFL